MGKIIRLTENDLSKLIKRVISEGAMEDVNKIVTDGLNLIDNKNMDIPIISKLNFEKTGDQTISVSPKNKLNSKMNFKIDFGGGPFKIEEIKLDGCSYKGGKTPKVTISLINKDFIMTWGAYRTLSSVSNGNGGWVITNEKNPREIKMKDVQTNFWGQIENELYGYKNRDDVKLKLWFCMDNENLWEIFRDLKKTAYQKAKKGVTGTDLTATITRIG